MTFSLFLYTFCSINLKLIELKLNQNQNLKSVIEGLVLVLMASSGSSQQTTAFQCAITTRTAPWPPSAVRNLRSESSDPSTLLKQRHCGFRRQRCALLSGGLGSAPCNWQWLADASLGGRWATRGAPARTKRTRRRMGDIARTRGRNRCQVARER